MNYLIVNSADKDIGTAGSFRVQLETPIYDIAWVELISGSIPWNAAFAGCGYLLLRISQIRNNVVGTDNNIATFFVPVNEAADPATSGFICYDPVNPQCVTLNNCTLDNINVHLIAGGSVIDPSADMQFVLNIHRN